MENQDTRAHREALGRVAVNFQNLELIFVTCLCGLIGPDAGIGLRVAAEMSFKNIVNAFSAIFRYQAGKFNLLPPEVAAALEGLVKRARQIEDERNRLTHSYWQPYRGESDEALMQRIKLTAKGQLRLQHELLSAQQINDFADRIAQLYQDVLMFSLTEGRVAIPQPPGEQE